MNNKYTIENSYNNSDYLIKLYNSVFNNIYIKRIIFFHLNIYNILLPVKVKFESIEEWNNFDHKQYLNRVFLDFNHEFTELPDNIKQVKGVVEPPKFAMTHPISYLTHVDSFSFSYFKSKDFSSPLLESIRGSSTIASKFKKLVITMDDKKIPISIIPQSITHLKIKTCINDLLKNQFPPNLKSLTLVPKMKRIYSYENSCFPESLTSVDIRESVPSILNQFSSSKNLVKLKYEYIDLSINPDIVFSNSLQVLKIHSYLFNSSLPYNLKSFDLRVALLQHPIQFPPSLESLRVSIRNHYNLGSFQNAQSFPPNLKTLEFQCTRIIDSDGYSIFPDKLERLVIFAPFDQVLLPNQLPSSLTYLYLGDSYNQVINANVLPVNLVTLILGTRYEQPINPLSIPQRLKLLHIVNPLYSHPIYLPASTHPNITIECATLSLYYDHLDSQICKLRLPTLFTLPLSTLRLQDKSKLEYLHLGRYFNHPIHSTDLPTQNNIKTLVLSSRFRHAINLEYFQKLETIVIYNIENTPPIITTSSKINNNNTITYNNYKLKNIIVSPKQSQFIKQLNINFYQFIKYYNKIKVY